MSYQSKAGATAKIIIGATGEGGTIILTECCGFSGRLILESHTKVSSKIAF